jgi:hypothetical protein
MSYKTALQVDAILEGLQDKDRYGIIVALFARLLLKNGIASGSADFAEFVAIFGKSVYAVLAEMQKTAAIEPGMQNAGKT